MEKKSYFVKRFGALALIGTLALNAPMIALAETEDNTNESNEPVIETQIEEEIEVLEAQPEAEDTQESAASEPIRDELIALYNKALTYKSTKYTDASYSVLERAIHSTKETLASEEATQDDINATLVILQEAIDNLEEKVESNDTDQPSKDTNTSKLDAILTIAHSYDASDFTEMSFIDLTEAITLGEGVLGRENATQKEINNAVASLDHAIDKLVEVKESIAINRVVLENLVIKAKEIDSKKYTKKSVESVNDAIAVVETLLAKEGVPEDRIFAAIETLQNQLDGLEITTTDQPIIKVEEDKPNETGVTSTPPKNVSNNKESVQTADEVSGALEKESSLESVEVLGQKLPNTATSTFSILLVGFIAFMIGGLGLLFGRRKRA